jgi:hypothetical protein
VEEDYGKHMRVKEAAIMHDGVIWTGRRHSDVIRKIIDQCGREAAPVRGAQGFITECGKFLDRKDAAKVAFEAGQVPELHPILMSEDLY